MADVGMNLAPVTYYGTEFPFIDRMKAAGTWGSFVGTIPLDVNGNPTAIPTGAPYIQTVVGLDPVQEVMTDVYELTYSGTATFQVVGATIISSTPGKIVFQYTNTTTNMATLILRSISATDPVHDIHIVRQDQVDAFNHGAIFNPDFIAQVSNWQTLRFMDWGNINNTTVSSWDQRSHVSDASWAGQGNSTGVPIEIMLKLANEAKTDMWFNIPTWADDTYVRNALQLIKDNLAPGLKVHVEYSNEMWNLGFQQSTYGQTMANKLFGKDVNKDGVIDPNNPAEAVYDGRDVYYGYRSAQIASIANSVFSGADDSRLKMVFATQNGNATLEKYLIDGVAKANVGTMKTLFDEWSVTSYFGAELGGSNPADKAKILGWANSGQAGIDAALQELAHGGAGLSLNSSIDDVAKYLVYSKSVADKYGLDLVGYEGGFHGSAVAFGSDQQTIRDFFARLMADPGMKDLYTYWWETFEKAGGKMMAAYYDVARPSVFGAFGTMDTLYDPKTPRYNALLEQANPKAPSDTAQSAQSVGDPVLNAGTYLSAIQTQYLTYGGREPSSAEYSQWTRALQNGATAEQIKDAILGSSLGTAYVQAQINSAYQTYGGRSASAGELQAWENVLNGNNHDFGVVRDAILKSPLGVPYMAQAITQTYQVYAGRAPIGNEIANWQAAIRSGTSVDAMRQAILNDSLGQGHTRATVANIYTSLAGRDATPEELANAKTALLGGADFSTVRANVLSDVAVHAFEVQQVTEAYRTYGGRAPTDAELTVWHNALVAGSDYNTVRSAILSGPLGQAYTKAQISAAYQDYAGRVANAGEVSAWETVLSGNDHNFGVIRDAILNTSLGTAYTDAQINAAYQTYGGRAASTGELRAWETVLNTNNHNFDVVRDAILNTSLGKAYTDAQINKAYQTYGGRSANASELRAWEGALNGNNHNFDAVRDAILNTTLGKAYTSAQITSAYQTYAGRAATAGEQDAWQNVLNGNNHDFSAVKSAILNNPLGGTYAGGQISNLYQQYFQRAASTTEQASWLNVLRSGGDFDTVRDALMSNAGSAATTQQAYGTAQADTFQFPTALKAMTITGFDPVHDVINLQGLGFSSINPLDSAHARDIHQVDGTNDVLITLDATHGILLHDISVSQLSVSDFLL